MKHLLSTVMLLLAAVAMKAQIMQASIGPGSSPNRVIIYIKPTVPVNGVISTLQFNLAIQAGVTPTPTMTIVGIPAIGSGWIIDPSYTEGSYRHYQVVTAASFPINIGAVETQVMELEFTGGPSGPSNVSLVTLGFGGLTGNALFFCSGAIFSNEGQLYYARNGTSVVNNMSYTGPLTSIATIAGVILPVKWLAFNVVKNGNNALLDWKVSNEEKNDHYLVQRSLNGTDFSTIGTVNKTGTGSGVKDYAYTDAGINSQGVDVLYYRLLQVDIDGRNSFSDTRMIKLNKSNGQIIVFPNPVTKGFYVNVPEVNPGSRNIKLNLFSNSGQLVQSRSISAIQASNYYFDISQLALAAGPYQLQVVLDGQVLKNVKLLINK